MTRRLSLVLVAAAVIAAFVVVAAVRARRGRDVVATFPASDRKAAQAKVVVPSARIVEVGQVRLKGSASLREQQNTDPGQVVPVTFALSPEQVLIVNYAEQNATEVRLSLLRPGESSELTKKQRVYQRDPDPEPQQ